MCGTVNGPVIVLLAAAVLPAAAAEPPVINPFGQAPPQREDAVPGYVELSDGTIHSGQVYLTRDKRLQVYDEKMKRQREVPLRVVKQIECKVVREWMEKEWKFNRAASSVKMFTGREYPAREYVHTITLHDGRTITGPLSGVVYVQPEADRQRPRPERFILHKRAKGELDEDFKSLKYVKQIKYLETRRITVRFDLSRHLCYATMHGAPCRGSTRAGTAVLVAVRTVETVTGQNHAHRQRT